MFFTKIYPREGKNTTKLLTIPRCAEEEQQQRAKTQRESGREKGETSAPPSAKLTEKGKKLKDDLDQILEKIDNVLEENAEEFVKNYVQRGGE